MSDQGARGSRVMLEVSELRHVFGSGDTVYEAIGSLSFDVREGEFVSVVGPSGAGKTTLLRCLSGLLRPTGGTVCLLGQRVEGVPPGMAMVFQDYSRSLFPWLTVEANVQFPLESGEIAKDVVRDRVKESLEAVGLSHAGTRYPWQLSGGMQQRVAIARALAYRPRLLLMDEPFASVDAQTRADLEDLSLRVSREFEMTVVVVTHDIDESVYLADRVLVLSAAPASLLANLPVELPRDRDQIYTRELENFVHLRGQVARLVRGQEPDSETKEFTP